MAVDTFVKDVKTDDLIKTIEKLGFFYKFDVLFAITFLTFNEVL